jgi:hypothetical protein
MGFAASTAVFALILPDEEASKTGGGEDCDDGKPAKERLGLPAIIKIKDKRKIT